jgi:hypothetical protein
VDRIKGSVAPPGDPVWLRRRWPGPLQIGDQLIIAAAARLRVSSRPSCVASRHQFSPSRATPHLARAAGSPSQPEGRVGKTTSRAASLTLAAALPPSPRGRASRAPRGPSYGLHSRPEWINLPNY